MPRGAQEPKRPVLTREQLLALEDELIIEYQKDEFQRTLHEFWGAAGDDEFAKVKARQDACLPYQVPILERYGFDGSRHGLAQSVYAYNDYPIHEWENWDFMERSACLSWLVNPSMQWATPMPPVPPPLYSAMPGGFSRQEDLTAAGINLSVVARRLSGEHVTTVNLFRLDSIGKVREAIERHSIDGGQVARPFKLVFGGSVLQDSQTPGAAGLYDGAELSVINLPPFQVLTACGDRAARLYDAATGECLQVFSGHASTVTSAAFSPDSLRVATSSKDRTARVWNPTTGECMATFTGHSKYVNSAAFNPTGDYVITSSDDCTLKLWDVATGTCDWTYDGEERCVNSAVFSPDGLRVLFASGDGTAKILNAWTGKCEQVLRGHGSYLNSAVFSPDGLKVATASDDCTAKLFDAATGTCHQTFWGHSKAVNSVEFSSDGRQLLTASDDHSVLLFESTYSAMKGKLELNNHVNSAVFSPDRRHILTACDNRTASLFRALNGEHVLTFNGHAGAVYRAVFGTT